VFQLGNAHLVVEGLAVLAMMAFDRGRAAKGGALLAAAILSKIAPGLLGVSLLAGGRWRGAVSTALFAVAITAIALPIVGMETFTAFFATHLPGVASGAAYDFLASGPDQVFLNLSPFAIPFKLAALGVPLEPWQWGPRASTLFTLGAFLLAGVVGRRSVPREGRLAMWLAVLCAAALRSPMAPSYVLGGVTIALVIVGAEREGAMRWGTLAVGVAAPLVFVPGAGLPMAFSLLAQLGVFLVLGWLVLRSWDSSPATPGDAHG
jgi:hypothetical protein